MWPFQTKSDLHLRVSRTHWALFEKNPLLVPSSQPVARGAYSNFEDLSAIIWPADYKNRSCRLHVAVADELTRHFLMQAPTGLRNLAELREAALARFMTLYGEAAHAWLLQADWSVRRPFIVSALPEIVLVSLKALCERQQTRLASVVPAWILVCNQATQQLPANGWLAVAEERSLSLLGLQAGRAVHFRHQWVSVSETPASLVKLLAREQVAVQHAVEAKVCWTGTASWLPSTGKHEGWDFQRLVMSS